MYYSKHDLLKHMYQTNLRVCLDTGLAYIIRSSTPIRKEKCSNTQKMATDPIHPMTTFYLKQIS